MQQQARDSLIQELNYKITVALNSESKSEVEGLRWIITRRAVLAIALIVSMVFVSLRFASYRTHERNQEKQRLAAATGNPDAGIRGGGAGGGHTVPTREMGTQTEEVMMRSVEEGNGPSYVSLG